MSPDEYIEQCRNRGCEPCIETLAALTERQSILDYIYANHDAYAVDIAKAIAQGHHEP